jgi:DNA-binding GntR family transcriptional regulator
VDHHAGVIGGADPPGDVDHVRIVARGSRGATDAVHDRLRARILSGEVMAGSELSQAQVAKEFGVSRGPVREAFRLLQREGLIEAHLNRRARVTGLSLEDVEHVYALRVVNEALALTVSVPRFTDDDLDELDTLVAVVGESRAHGFGVWEQQHQRFHSLLVSHAGDGMRASLAQWAEHTERYRRVYVADQGGGWSQGAGEHALLAQACRARDVVGATRLLARHLSRAALALVASMDPGHEPVLLRAAIRQATSAGDVSR